MDNLFLQILNMSITSSYVILFVLAVRLLLKKAPKCYSYALWSVVLFRLCCPFSFNSIFALLPVTGQAVPPNIIYAENPQIASGVSIIDNAINAVLPAATPQTSINPMQIWLAIGTF
ncbi:MAG: M56 family metallopeptidase, partial [Oscillospiraceae bacterium]